ncbi:MAG: hypothetical protein MI919_27190, partial [Holophagales bacterium]|nr:hypothetical protein [Holophagales bacterium]
MPFRSPPGPLGPRYPLPSRLAAPVSAAAPPPALPTLLCLLLAGGQLGCAGGEPVAFPAPHPEGSGPGIFAPTELVAEPETALRPADRRGVVPADARVADYQLDAHLDAETHRLKGTARLTWRNTSGSSVRTLPFHLYMNGFRADDTAWMRGGSGGHRGFSQAGDSGAWGYIDVHSVHLEPAPENLLEAETAPLAAPLPWAEGEDPSVMDVTLPREVAPGESLTLRLEFTTQLPRVYARTGYAGDFHAVAQWFPKIGVLGEEGWNQHVFTLHDEFFADFGNYRVSLDVPEEMVVGATG